MPFETIVTLNFQCKISVNYANTCLFKYLNILPSHSMNYLSLHESLWDIYHLWCQIYFMCVCYLYICVARLPLLWQKHTTYFAIITCISQWVGDFTITMVYHVSSCAFTDCRCEQKKSNILSCVWFNKRRNFIYVYLKDTRQGHGNLL